MGILNFEIYFFFFLFFFIFFYLFLFLNPKPLKKKLGRVPPRGPDPLWSGIWCSERVSPPKKTDIWMDEPCNAARVTGPAYSQGFFLSVWTLQKNAIKLQSVGALFHWSCALFCIGPCQVDFHWWSIFKACYGSPMLHDAACGLLGRVSVGGENGLPAVHWNGEIFDTDWWTGQPCSSFEISKFSDESHEHEWNLWHRLMDRTAMFQLWNLKI